MVDWKKVLKSSRSRKLILAFLLLLLVLVFVGIRSSYIVDYVQPARESVLKHDLQMMREAIDNYTLDKEKPPQFLQDLVDAGYLRQLPVDPITHRRDWVVQLDDVVLSPSAVVRGIADVHSSSKKNSLEGTRYDTW